MLRIGAVQFEFGFQRNAVCKAEFYALIDGIARRIYEVVEELQNEVIARIGDGEVLSEYFEEPFVTPVFGLVSS
jgi:hypothetical protein